MVPTRRTGDWVMSSVGHDTLIFDRATNELHTLKPHHVAVWDACTGRNSVTDIARQVHLDPGTVDICLAHLTAAGLLELRTPGVSRRKLLATSGAVAGIISISAPRATAATSETCACGPIPCNIAICDEPPGCYYVSDAGAAGNPCNGGAGVCDNLGNCTNTCTCPPVACNIAIACYPTYCDYTPDPTALGKGCNNGVYNGTCDDAGNCNPY